MIDQTGMLGPWVSRIRGTGIVMAVLGFGATGLVALLGEGGAARFYQSYLVNFTYFLSLTLGALFFVILQHLTRSSWSVAVRRVGETAAANVGVVGVLAVPLVFGLGELYPWANAGRVAGDQLLAAKSSYLNPTFFVIRLIVYFAVWCGTAQYFFRRSTRQDATGDPGLTRDMQRASGPAMVGFAFTVTFAAFDLLMSRSPHWFSTIFGVYFFAGSLLGFLALMTLIVFIHQHTGVMRGIVSERHFYDMGTLMFGFVIFWAYIGFSQYMLIWCANIPEETIWYFRRQTGMWTDVSLLFILGGHFLIPFLALISRFAKRRRMVVTAVAIWILVMHWVDVYWLAMPEVSAGGPSLPLHPLDLLCFLGFAGVMIGAAAHRLRARSLVPIGDPRLAESIEQEGY